MHDADERASEGKVTRVSESVAEFWREFASTQPEDPTPRFLEAFHFDDNEASADELAQLVLSGRKRATAALVWSHEHSGDPPPQPGSLSIVTTFAGEPVCVIETLSVEVVPFDEVTADFAAAEGEGDGSLEYWRRAHEAFFGRECERIGRTPDTRMPIVCERFEVVYRGGR
ncbi:MAG: ASCH domain-containing protein [Armatimonadetes bacterium]|nr:ASCH domain-containing protein [Armatimonadota bacterium]